MARTKGSKNSEYREEEIRRADMVCMNPYAICSGCIFNQSRLSMWCKPEEKEAKRLFDISRTRKTAA